MRTCFVVLAIILIGTETFSECVTKKFHLITTHKENWYRAFHHCHATGMRMASILSAEENDKVLEQINNAGFDIDYWLAGTQLGSSDYYWMGHNKAFNFKNWSDGEPNHKTEEEACVHISYQTHKWNDLDCLFRAYFVCEEVINEPPIICK